MTPFAQWLTEIGLERYVTVFSENNIDFDVMGSLSEGDLRELGLAIGDRKRLLTAVAQLNAQSTADTIPMAPPKSATEPAHSEGERRQLTVMFCDLVGSTALSEKLDPEELRSLLHNYRTVCGEVIARYEGFVARYVGDGILTYFGWPKAHEEDAERALRAALEIVQAVKRASSSEALSVRIGIATGPVVVGEQASVGNESKLAVGSTPNLAARLQGLASADQIVIASSTRRLVRNAFELADLGERELKGISEPVHAWRVIAVGAAASRFEAAAHGFVTPMVGREQELGLLLDRWQQAQEGEGQVVLLSGEPGIGKSRILNALREKLETQGVATLRFQCSPYHINSAFYPSIDNFERALKFTRDESPESKLDKLETLIVTHLDRPLADVRFIASMLSIPYESRYGELPMTPQKFKDETLRTLVDLCEASADKQPTAMLFEDAHWADPTSLEVLELLIDRVKKTSLLMVLTHRPEFQSRWSQQGHVSALNLSKLTRAQSGTMVEKLTHGKEFPAGLLDQILDKADGVPLYVEELTKSILESGELKDAGNHYDYAGSARSVTIPATLRDSLMARLDRFAPVKEIAQIGAAIGRAFSYAMIAAVAPQTKADLDVALEQLTESGLALRRGAPPDATYTFKHALVQDAAYDSLLKSRRQTLHAKIARVIEEHFPNIKDSEPELVAQHHTKAGNTEAAIPLWLAAGTKAFQRLALTEAIAHLDKGAELNATQPDGLARDANELQLRITLGMTWMAARGWPDEQVAINLEPAVRLARLLNQTEALFLARFGLWVRIHTMGHQAHSLSLALDILAEANQRDDSFLKIAGCLSEMISSFWLGDLSTAQISELTLGNTYREDQHGKIVNLLSYDVLTVVRIYAAHRLWMMGYPDQAVCKCDEKDDIARQIEHPINRALALTLGNYVFHYRREPVEFLKRADEAQAVVNENGLVFLAETHVLLARFLALLDFGQFQEGITLIDKFYRSPFGLLIGKPYFFALRAEAMAKLSRRNEGLANIAEAIEQIERPGWNERSHYAEILRIKGWILQQQGDYKDAEFNLRASIDFARKQQAKSWELRTSTTLAEILAERGDRQQAIELLAPVYHWFTEGFDTHDLKQAKKLLDQIA